MMNIFAKISKSILLYMMFVLLTPNLEAQDFKITKGMCLRYNVTSEGEKFKMYVIMKDVFPSVKFEWIMLKNPCVRGTISMSTDAWKTADKQNNLFDPGDQKLNDQSCIWLSQYIYESLKNNGEVKMTPDQNEKHYLRNGFQAYPVILDGKATTIQVMYAESDDSTHDKFWINENTNCPVIFKMDIGFKMELYEIRSVSKVSAEMKVSGNDLPTLIGKSSFDPRIYYLCNQLTEACPFTIEYKVAGNGTETVLYHYFSQINGLKMEVVNDTLKSMVIYNNVKGDENGWVRYPGELPFGLNFDMKREEIEKLIGKANDNPSIPNSVIYPDKNMMITYNSDDLRKAKMVCISIPPK